MVEFHRSPLVVGDMDKEEKLAFYAGMSPESLEVEGEEERSPRQRRNLTMIYLLFLAEAIMAASLSSQIAVLVPSSSGCLTMNTSLLRSILECAYFFGSATGLFWGRAVDRFGRRRIALAGLTGMSTCCLTMAFARNFAAFALLRFVGGAIGSATTISGLAMLADFTHGSNDRAKTVSRLPVVAVCGSIGPLTSSMLRHVVDAHPESVFTRFPELTGQIACTGLVFAIAIAEAILLEETLPGVQPRHYYHEDDAECEKAGFLRKPLPDDSDDSLNISIIEALRDDAAAPLPSKIGTIQMLTAPSVLVLLASYSIFSLHSSTFEVVLSHIAHTQTHDAGMGIPCAWLRPVMMAVSVLAAIRILGLVPSVVGRVGVLTMYRRISLGFPILYTLVPVFALLVNFTGGTPMISATFSTIAMYFKATLAGAAQVLVLLLVLTAAPDASSTGTVLGVVSISELFKALAVGFSGISYYLSNEYSMGMVNALLWAMLAVTALIGVAVTWNLRETPRVGTDIPEECLVWRGMFDAESDDDEGF